MSLYDLALRNLQRAEARLNKLQAELEQVYRLPPGDFRRLLIVMTQAEIKRGMEALCFHVKCVEAHRSRLTAQSL